MKRAITWAFSVSVLGALASFAQAADPPKQSKQAALAAGEKTYDHWCAPCHAAGPGHPGTQSLELKYGGKHPAVLTDRKDLSPATVSAFVRQGVLLMAPFRKTEITDAELKDLSAFVARNYKGR